MNGTRHEVAADLRRAYDAIPSPVTIFRASGEYVYLNPAAVEVLSDVAGNLVADDLIGQRWQEVFPAQVSTAFGEHFETLATSPTSVSQPLITPAYESRSGSSWASRMWVDSRALVHVVSVKQDDDLPRAGLQRVIRDFPFGACVVFDRDFRCISVTGQGLARTGLDPSRLVGRTIGEVWPEDVCRILEQPGPGSIPRASWAGPSGRSGRRTSAGFSSLDSTMPSRGGIPTSTSPGTTGCTRSG